MAILLEGMTLVFENSTLENKHPDGLYGFMKTWDNGSFCTDGTISRLSFFEIDDGFSVFIGMQDMGLDVCVDYAADVAVFTHSGGLWAPCLWLETETNIYGTTACWHCTEEMGNISVPKYFRKGRTLSKQHGTWIELSERINRVALEDDIAIFLDNQSNTLIYGPRRLSRH